MIFLGHKVVGYLVFKTLPPFFPPALNVYRFPFLLLHCWYLGVVTIFFFFIFMVAILTDV